jgi:hypothetical protein
MPLGFVVDFPLLRGVRSTITQQVADEKNDRPEDTRACVSDEPQARTRRTRQLPDRLAAGTLR